MFKPTINDRHHLIHTGLRISAFIILLFGGTAQATNNYNTNGQVLANIQLHYAGSVSTAGTHRPEGGWFKFKNGLADTYRGGWFKVSVVPTSPPPQGYVDSSVVMYPVGLSLDNAFLRNVPGALRNSINIKVDLLQKPHWDDRPELQRAVHVTGNAFQAEVVRDRQHNRIATIGTRNAETTALYPYSDVQWIDADVLMRVDIWPDPVVRDTGPGSGHFVYEMPVTLRTISSPVGRISPYIVPIALLGKPPGDQSWQQLTNTSDACATLAVYESNSTLTTVEESFGIGPISFDDGTISNKREESVDGVYQEMCSRSIQWFRTNNPYGIGEGDVMIVLTYPTFKQYQTARDYDSHYAGGVPTIVSFPMKALRQSRFNSTVDQLRPAEKNALGRLDPLLTNPRALLNEPRYYRIASFSIQASSTGGGFSNYSITRDMVENRIASSTTRDDSQSFSFPVGGIASLLGSPLPIPDITYRRRENTTTTVEYTTNKSMGQSSGTMVEFSVGDSNPQKELHFEVYYDTFFRTFAFRDASTSVFKGLRRNLLSYLLKKGKADIYSWATIASKDSTKHLVGGYVGDLAKLMENPQVTFVSVDGSAAHHTVAVIDEGDFAGYAVIADMAAGRYQVVIDDALHEMVVKDSEVSFRTLKELPYAYECSDRKDNDGDGFKDYPWDPECRSFTDDNEGESGEK